MEFETAKTTVKEWIPKDKSKRPFELTDCDGAARRINFSVPNSSETFYIVVPEFISDKADKWHVWSDNEDVLPKLSPLHDFIDSERQKSLDELLKRIENCFPLKCDSDDDDDGDYGDDLEDYYANEDDDALREEASASVESSDDDTAEPFFQGTPSIGAITRLKKDYKDMAKGEGKYGVIAKPKGDNLLVWDVKLTEFSGTKLAEDLVLFAERYKREAVIYLEMQFPATYPMDPPFVRIIRPRFKFLTGHVTIGGSICMEMLTKSGWRPTNDIESILVQIRSEIMSDSNARLDANDMDRAYDEQEARMAFRRMVDRYGWNK